MPWSDHWICDLALCDLHVAWKGLNRELCTVQEELLSAAGPEATAPLEGSQVGQREAAPPAEPVLMISGRGGARERPTRRRSFLRAFREGCSCPR